MTDITTPTTTQSFRLADLPIAPVALLCRARAALAGSGRGFVAILAAYGRALELAYSAPYTRPSQPQQASEEDLEGRDPNW